MDPNSDEDLVDGCHDGDANANKKNNADDDGKGGLKCGSKKLVKNRSIEIPLCSWDPVVIFTTVSTLRTRGLG